MPIDKYIFGLRFQSNAEISPAQEEIRVFLESTAKEGGREKHDSDLAAYRDLLEDVQEFESHQQQGVAQQDITAKMFYGVLSHSRFVNPALKSAVEEYKYLAHALLTLDFKKPTAFIKSANEEMSKLNPKNSDHAVRLARLRAMVNERKETLGKLQRQRAALTEELGNIALYIRDNLVKIERLCESAIVILVDLQLGQKKEKELIEDIKTQFKEHLKDFLSRGPITKQYIETVKKDVSELSQKIAVLLREDVYAVTQLYEAIHSHAGKIASQIDALMAKARDNKGKSYEDDRDIFERVERVRVSLIKDYRFELKTMEIRADTKHNSILVEKRKEMVNHLFELLQKDRRSSWNRRRGEDRRKFRDPNYNGPERRSGKDRRSRKERRKR